jgi:hypothetical protein
MNIRSKIDVITNSSTEVFTLRTDKTLSEVSDWLHQNTSGFCEPEIMTLENSDGVLQELIDFGYVVNLDTPDSIGGEYVSDGITYKNAILLYRTKARYGSGEKISGTMYLDDNYSRAYCQYHFNLGIPEGVCYTLD